MRPELGRDATVAIVLIAAIIGLATDSVMLGATVLAAAIAVVGAAILIRSRLHSPRGRLDSRAPLGPHGHQTRS